MAATASETATMKVSSTSVMSERNAPPYLMKPVRKMTTEMPTTRSVRILESSVSFFWSGVSSSAACERASAILPISVSMPVATTTARPRP